MGGGFVHACEQGIYYEVTMIESTFLVFVINFHSIIPSSFLWEEDNGMYMDGARLIASNHNRVYVTHQELDKMQIKIQCMVLWRMMTDYLY